MGPPTMDQSLDDSDNLQCWAVFATSLRAARETASVALVKYAGLEDSAVRVRLLADFLRAPKQTLERSVNV